MSSHSLALYVDFKIIHTLQHIERFLLDVEGQRTEPKITILISWRKVIILCNSLLLCYLNNQFT